MELPRTTDPSTRHRLTASNVARYFKHGCDRLFRWEAEARRDSTRPPNAPTVPSKPRSTSRPGIELLMAGGDTFEHACVAALVAEHAPGDVHVEGGLPPLDAASGRAPKIPGVPLASLASLLNEPAPPLFIAQPEIVFDDASDAPARFLARHGLDPATVELRPAMLDLLEVRTADDAGAPYDDGRARLRIWDFKASAKAKHEHFAQVAYYSLLLDEALVELGLEDRYAVDHQWGVIRSKAGDEPFEIGPYRRAVAGALEKQLASLLDLPPAAAHYHVCARCLVCEYVEVCETDAETADDLSRVPYITSASKRRLNEAGVRTCAMLAAVEPASDEAAALRHAGHDLSVHLDRYITAATALGSGTAIPLGTTTLAVPAFESIRVVVSAEQDGVSGTVFALGLKTNEGYDADAGRPTGMEAVYVAERDAPEEEARILTAFLADLNGLFQRTDAANRAVADAPDAAQTAYDDACTASDALKAAHAATKAEAQARKARTDSKVPELKALALDAKRLEAEAKAAKDHAAALKDAAYESGWQKRIAQKTLHLYTYDSLDLTALKGALERHLGGDDPELQLAIVGLVRLFPPDDVLPDADTFRSVPGTVVADALRCLVALPSPYLYDLRTVSEHYQPANAAGEPAGSLFLPRYGFGWAHSNQVAFERIHDVWNDQPFAHGSSAADAVDGTRTYSPEAILEQVRRTVLNKLRATDSVVRRLKKAHAEQKEEDDRGSLLLRKEPFRLYTDFDPTDFGTAEALQTFALLESALAELQTRALHTLAPDERAARFEALAGLHYLPDLDDDVRTVYAGKPNERSFAQLLWFETTDAVARDAKFSAGDSYLVLTPENEPDALSRTVDGPMFAAFAGFRGANYRTSIAAVDRSDPDRIRVALRPDQPEKFREVLLLDAAPRPYVLDKPHTDALVGRLLGTLAWLRTSPPEAAHVADLLATGTRPEGAWTPPVQDAAAAEGALRAAIASATDPDTGRAFDPDAVLNGPQWAAVRGAMQAPLSLVWGPPGTGKTHVAGHLLALYASAAQAEGRPLRILVTAATHYAIVNVLKSVAKLAPKYGLAGVEVVKLGGEKPADDNLPGLEHLSHKDLAARVAQPAPACLVVGSTVWELYKALSDTAGFRGQPLFDVVLVDEASQTTLPQALIALCAAKPHSNVVLAGDDRQLPPIVHGSYPADLEHLLSSVFAFARHHADLRGDTDATLFQLTRNFRMSEPLTAYPRQAIYETYDAHFPDIRSALEPALDYDAAGTLDVALHPERPAVLVRYTSPVPFTSRNPLEARLAAHLVQQLSETLVDSETDRLYTPQDFAARGAAVLAPHRAQNAAVRAELALLGFGTAERPMPLVDTVEKLQGQEREAVVVSYGVADPDYADAEAGFLLGQARFNVSATRAQRKLVVLCSDAVLDAVPPDRDVLVGASMLKEFRDYCDDGHRVSTWTDPEHGDVHLDLHWKGFPLTESTPSPSA